MGNEDDGGTQRGNSAAADVRWRRNGRPSTGFLAGSVGDFHDGVSALTVRASGRKSETEKELGFQWTQPWLFDGKHAQLPESRAGMTNGRQQQRRSAGGDSYGGKCAYFNDGKRRIDYVLVYEQGVRTTTVEANRAGRSFVEKEKLRQFFEENLAKEGLELEEEVHKQPNNAQITVYVKVHVNWAVLCRQAEALKIKMPMRLRDTFADQLQRQNRSWLSQFTQRLKRLLGGGNGDGGGGGGATDGRDSDDVEMTPVNAAGLQGNVTWTFQRKKIDKFAIVDQEQFFTPCQRMEIVWEILQKARNDPSDEKKRGIEHLLELKVYDSAFPLHDGPAGVSKRISPSDWCERQRLRATWATWSCIFKTQPLELIRRYYGEKIGFYFAFLAFYTKMLVFPSFVGLFTFMYGLGYNNDDDLVNDICDETRSPGNYMMCPICLPPNCEIEQLAEGCTNAQWDYRMDNEATLVMACLTVIWATVFLKSWKRREAELSFEWDTYEMEQADGVTRPDYEHQAPVLKPNPVTGELEPHVPASSRVLRLTASICITLFCLCAVGAALILLVVARIALYGVFLRAGIHHSVEMARWFVHLLIFVVVFVFDIIYTWIGTKTTSLECPRTQSQWLSSYLWKIFIFEMLNEFVPIAYAAWVKGNTTSTPLDLTWRSELCDAGGCMSEVTELISVLLLTRMVIGNAAEIGGPFLKLFLTRFSCHSLKQGGGRPGSGANVAEDDDEESATRDHEQQWCHDEKLVELELDGVADEYKEMIIQFAFCTLFVPAFPIAPVICLLNNVLEIRVDAINFVVAHRRPLPIRAPGIQIWNQFLDIIAKLAILCNAGLIAFSSEMIPRLYYKHVYNNGTDYDGFTEFSLSSIPTAAWKHRNSTEAYHELTSRNVSECYYQDYRSNLEREDFRVKQQWWEVMCARLIAFSVFIILAFTFQWLYNFVVPDVPHKVALKIQRRRHVVNRAFDDAHEKRARHAAAARAVTAVATEAFEQPGAVVDTVHSPRHSVLNGGHFQVTSEVTDFVQPFAISKCPTPSSALSTSSSSSAASLAASLTQTGKKFDAAKQPSSLPPSPPVPPEQLLPAQPGSLQQMVAVGDF